MNQEKETAVAAAAATEEKKWFSLRVISGKEKKIQERILLEIERSGWKDFVFSVIVPTEKVYKIRNGKKVMQERNLLPGYILIEAFGPKLNGDVAKKIADIPNVIHFLGKEQPIPMTQNEANRLLGKVDESTESGETLSEPFLIGETVKIIDGAFAEFVGDVQEVNEEKKKLKVVVKIFGRGTEMELNFMQVEKIS
jgi:transcriptional antiterminator NusG